MYEQEVAYVASLQSYMLIDIHDPPPFFQPYIGEMLEKTKSKAYVARLFPRMHAAYGVGLLHRMHAAAGTRDGGDPQSLSDHFPYYCTYAMGQLA